MTNNSLGSSILKLMEEKGYSIQFMCLELNLPVKYLLRLVEDSLDIDVRLKEKLRSLGLNC